jgi:hypothetical protein
VAEAVPQKVYLGCYYVNRHHYCWAVDLKAVPAQRNYCPQRLEEAPAAVGVAPEAVTLSLPEQNLIQILSLSATAEVQADRGADPAAARVNVASEQLSPCLDSVNAGWGQRLSFFSFLE